MTTINGGLPLAAAWNFPVVLRIAVVRARPSVSRPCTGMSGHRIPVRRPAGRGQVPGRNRVHEAGGRPYHGAGLQREAPTQNRTQNHGNMHRALHRARWHRSFWQCASSVTGNCGVHTRGQPSTDRACIPPLGNHQTFLVWLGHPVGQRTTGWNGTVYHARAITPCRPRPDAEVGNTSGDCARIMKDCLLVRRPQPLLPAVPPNPSRCG